MPLQESIMAVKLLSARVSLAHVGVYTGALGNIINREANPQDWVS